MQSISTLLINENSRLVILPAAGREWGKGGAERQWSMPLSVREGTALTLGQDDEGVLWFFFSPCRNSKGLGPLISSQAFLRGSKGLTVSTGFPFRGRSCCMVVLEFII